MQVQDLLKKQFRQKWNFCHHLLTLMLGETKVIVKNISVKWNEAIQEKPRESEMPWQLTEISLNRSTKNDFLEIINWNKVNKINLMKMKILLKLKEHWKYIRNNNNTSYISLIIQKLLHKSRNHKNCLSLFKIELQASISVFIKGRRSPIKYHIN